MSNTQWCNGVAVNHGWTVCPQHALLEVTAEVTLDFKGITHILQLQEVD